MYQILLCDDEKDIVTALEIYLRNDDYKIFKAYNGADALKILTRGNPFGSSGHYDASYGRHRCTHEATRI